ncbi:MAG: DNA helicase RecQ [Bacteroidetes bacterium]|jgi:ATP-dependent DNA helicase RecQ|nr:DNA helicase RecQ [Bacteroidota bacterium]
MKHITDEALYEGLKTYFGFDEFKGTQKEVIKSILDGHDTFVIMPTGGGKSLCYQLPAFMSKGTAIIISPLIALMKNQVDLVRAFGGKDGVAHFMNSSLSKKQLDQVRHDVRTGVTKMLYIAPESLTKNETVDFLRLLDIPFVAVDEAHCISEWGHDFRPEYRRIRQIVENIGIVPIMGLTASATPKVKDDVIKNLKMKKPMVYQSSFLRDNLYYEIRPKKNKVQTVKEIIAIIKKRGNQSGIVYCLSRKSTEELAESFRVNGIRALEYHAGMDSSTRSKNQDAFLMEDVDVIVATIAFGMGIDKPDVRFVIHFDVPKSIESYYQETGRAGRDGIQSDCILFYDYKDLTKLEHFLKDKPVAEREVGMLLLDEMASFCETSGCRRKGILHYFGEEYDDHQCRIEGDVKMCDNCVHPKERFDAGPELVKVLSLMRDMKERFLIKHIVQVIMGETKPRVLSFEHDKLKLFGFGKDKDFNYWKSIVRAGMLDGFIAKDIESYGTLYLTPAGESFIAEPKKVEVALDFNFEEDTEGTVVSEGQGGEGFDEALYGLLKEKRYEIAHENGLPPYIIFQDPSLEEMAIRYPITMDEMANIVGVSATKAQRYAQPFLDLIKEYVEENEIERPDDLIVKSVVSKSANKVYIIQSLDRKLDLEDIANSKGMTMEELFTEMENIVLSGTKLNLDHYVNEMIDEADQDDIFDYFRSAADPSVDTAIINFGKGVYSFEELWIMKIKFISEMAN